MDLNLLSPDVIADPYPHYEQLRAEGRVVWNETMGGWMVHRHADVTEVLSDPARFTSTVYQAGPFMSVWTDEPMFVALDPPEHTRLRQAVRAPFSRSAMAQLEPMVTAAVDAAFDTVIERLAAGEVVDVAADLLRGIPTAVIAAVLGVPLDMQAQFDRWSDDMMAAFGAALDPSDAAAQRLAAGRVAAAELDAFLQAEIERHRAAPPPTLLGGLLEANRDQLLSDREVRALCLLLLFAGNETTARWMSACVVLLARNSEVRSELAGQPDLIPAAAEEVMRFDSVTQGNIRGVVADTEVGGVALAAGSLVYTLAGAANRDPDVFEAPDIFDLHRDPNPHLGFGFGIHLCLGAPLARLETRVVLQRLLTRVVDWELHEVEYGPSWFVRGPDRLRMAGRSIPA